MAVLKGILIFIHILAAFGVIAAVLLQSGKSAGLSGSIAGGAEVLFGKKKGLDELFEKMTIIAVILFMVLSLVLALLF
ncbi:preprotein translocase subunit SecG [Carboxydothermus pertinax]|uniref:Protein-export membrane protein SecG n=1 Tax=Carboxydothermus pertinax TaxID=870242 RepID=A0A1L8CRK5_9THEO|nr:preprotein translocase subunit SecG [Carboxydothermus pertinax]GAV21556.1 preprotein translocase subunit SecG [Carboxydothermus pertinax]